jgi:hypothetical protein
MGVLFYFYFSIIKCIKYAINLGAIRSLKIKNNEEICLQDDETTPVTNLDDLRLTLKFSKGLIVMYIMYIFTIFPLWIILLVDIEQEWSSYIHQFPWLFFRLCSAATPVVYPLFHPSIRSGYKNAIDRYVLRKKKQADENQSPIDQKKKQIKSRDYFSNL